MSISREVAVGREQDLTPQLMTRLAVLWVQGQTWDQTAKAAKRPVVQSDGDRLRERLKDDPEWKRIVRETRRELIWDALAEGLTVLRIKARSTDEALAARAANFLVRVGETFYRHRPRTPAAADDPDPDAYILEGLSRESLVEV